MATITEHAFSYRIKVSFFPHPYKGFWKLKIGFPKVRVVRTLSVH